MSFVSLLAAIVFLFPLLALAGADRTPAEWVARLGAEHLAERDEASSALLALGSQAREEVRGALGSSDAEVQWRARELWKTLRWLVVPGADADVIKLVTASKAGKADDGESGAEWRLFVRKHGAASILLLAKLREGKVPAPGYENGIYALLDGAKVEEVAQVIIHSGTLRPMLEKPLDDAEPDKVTVNAAVNFMLIEMDLDNYKKAFDFGRQSYFADTDDGTLGECKDVAEKGNLSDYIDGMARGDIAGETAPGKRSAKLGFYVSLLSSLGKKDRAEALCDLAPEPGAVQKDVMVWKPFIESLLKAEMAAHVVKMLPHAAKPVELYLRSSAEVQMHNTAAADADWQAAMAALDAIKENKKDEMFTFGDVMAEMNDKRAESIFLKLLLAIPPDQNTDANAWFRLGGIAEDQHRYGYAADCYEMGVALSPGGGEDVVASGAGVIQEATGEETMRAIIKKLRDQAAGKEK